MVRKGVSPVIATVLLIAVAIAIGILVTTWITHWTSTQISSQPITCAINTNYIIESVEYNKTGGDTLLVKVTNKGAENLYGFSAVLDNGTHILDVNSTSWRINQGGISKTSPLRREKSAYVTVNLTINYTALGDTLTDVRILNEACNAVSARTTFITQY
jgi:flagellin-like protein